MNDGCISQLCHTPAQPYNLFVLTSVFDTIELFMVNHVEFDSILQQMESQKHYSPKLTDQVRKVMFLSNLGLSKKTIFDHFILVLGP